jgi:hypothetical protein
MANCMRKIIVGLLALLMLPVVFSFEWENLCTNNVTLRKSLNYTNCNSTSCDTGNSTFYKNCEFGCDNVTQSCKPSSYSVNLNFLFIFGGLVFIILMMIILKKSK